MRGGERLTSAGYESDGEPGPRPHYSEDYYGAFVRDPGGNSAEAVHKPSSSGTGRIDHLWLRTRDVAAQRRFWETVAPLRRDPAEARLAGLDPVRRRGRDVLVRRGRADRERAPRLPCAGRRRRSRRSTRPRSARGSPTTARRASGRTTTRATSARFVLDPDGNNIEAVCHHR